MVHALLYAAVQEGLLDGDPTIGDGFVRRVMRSPPDQGVLAHALEHVVLSGKVFAPFWLPREWRGELFERELLVPRDPGLDEDLIEAPGLSPALALAMLRARGHRWSQEDLLERYESLMTAYSTLEGAGGPTLEELKIRMALRNVIPIAPEEYSQEQLAAWTATEEAYSAFKPVLDCHNAYRRVLTHSLEVGALSALPLDTMAASLAGLSLAETSADRMLLLRIACKGLRRVPIGTSLRETIAMATSPEGQDLRHRLALWSESVRLNEAESAATVLGDVDAARRSLKNAKSLATIGEYSTYIGVPAAIVGAFVAGPLVTISGVVVSVVGGAVLVGQKLIERMNRWAMYGQN